MKGIFFTYLLTYGGAAMSIFRPFVGLLIYFSFAIIAPPSMWYWSVPPGRYSFIVAVALLVGWVLKGLGNWNFGRAGLTVWVFIAFWAWGALCGKLSEYPGNSYNWTVQQAKILLPFLVGITLITSTRQVKQIAWVLMLSQAYVAYELNLAYWGGFNRVAELGHAGMDNNCVSIAAVTGAGVAFFLGIREKILWRQLLCFASAILLAHIPMIGNSRGGMLALVLTGVLSFFLIPKRPIHYFYFLIAVVVGMRMAGPAVVHRFSSAFVDEEVRDGSAQSRLDMWVACYDLTQRYPIFGVGPMNWGRYAPEYDFPEGKEAHSLWLQCSAEMGWPGLILLLLFFGSVSFRLFMLIARPPPGVDPWHIDAARLVIGALFGFSVAATFVTIVGLEIPYYVALVGAGTLKMVDWEQRQQAHQQASQAAVQPARAMAYYPGTPQGTHPQGA